MQDCIFCKILAGQAAGSFVYRDETVAAFMDIHQTHAYKVLIVPVAHVETIYDLAETQASAIFQLAVRLSRVIRNLSSCDGLNVFQSNGAAAGQEVFHFHLHLLPRFVKGRIPPRYPDIGEYPERSFLDQLASDIMHVLSTS